MKHRPIPFVVHLACVLAVLCAFCAASLAAAIPETTEKAKPAVSPPPVPPTLKSPVDFFRDLLAMAPAQRQQALATRSPEVRKQILAKVREYEALRPDTRELRLKATELRWYLIPLLNTDKTNRAERLAAIPADDRKLVEDRLHYWDSLPDQAQASLLTNQMTLRRLSEIEETNSAAPSATRIDFLEEGVRQWQALSEEERRTIKSRFDQVFSLTPEEKSKVLRTISGAERDQIQKTLRRFEQLPPAQRAQCIANFEKFANLSLEERQQFLKNADRWNALTPNERQAWRELVQQLQPQPPPPPGASQPPPPPEWHRPRPVFSATNR